MKCAIPVQSAAASTVLIMVGAIGAELISNTPIQYHPIWQYGFFTDWKAPIEYRYIGLQNNITGVIVICSNCYR